MVDRLRKEIQERLDQVLAEAEKLRQALVALDTDGSRKRTARSAATRQSAGSSVQSRPGRRPRRRTAPGAARTAPGATKSQIFETLSHGQAMTAGEVASATGLERATVSATLSKLAKGGEVRKADRRYALPASRASGVSGQGS